MQIAAVELNVIQAVGQFLSYAILAVFAENVVFSRALGMSSLLRLVNDPEIKTWHYCGPIIIVQLFSAPLGWLAHNQLFPWLRTVLPAWLPVAALRPMIYVSCSTAVMAVVWLVLGLWPQASRQLYRSQLPGATFNCCVLGTLLICANQNFTLIQTIGFGLGSGIGYLFAVLVVDEGRRRLKSKEVPAIFRGLPSSLIYVGILSLAIYGLVGHPIAV